MTMELHPIVFAGMPCCTQLLSPASLQATEVRQGSHIFYTAQTLFALHDWDSRLGLHGAGLSNDEVHGG